jgi:hypothetical protein
MDNKLISAILKDGLDIHKSIEDQRARYWQYHNCQPPPNPQSIVIHPIITEDIDYEIVEPSKLPPSNTIDK